MPGRKIRTNRAHSSQVCEYAQPRAILGGPAIIRVKNGFPKQIFKKELLQQLEPTQFYQLGQRRVAAKVEPTDDSSCRFIQITGPPPGCILRGRPGVALYKSFFPAYTQKTRGNKCQGRLSLQLHLRALWTLTSKLAELFEIFGSSVYSYFLTRLVVSR